MLTETKMPISTREEFSSVLNEQVLTYIEESGMEYSKISDITGISVPTISHLVKRKSNKYLSTITKAAICLGFSIKIEADDKSYVLEDHKDISPHRFLAKFREKVAYHVRRTLRHKKFSKHAEEHGMSASGFYRAVNPSLNPTMENSLDALLSISANTVVTITKTI